MKHGEHKTVRALTSARPLADLGVSRSPLLLKPVKPGSARVPLARPATPAHAKPPSRSARPARPSKPIVYPISDGKPMAEGTVQLFLMVKFIAALHHYFENRPDVFVAGDAFWYPVEGHPKIRRAPDIMLAFGRPRGDRGSYMQWEEAGVPIHVVFEIMSPGNTAREMQAKFNFYQKHGVEEYYIFNPPKGTLEAYVRQAPEPGVRRRAKLVRIANPVGFVSPRMGLRFDVADGELLMLKPDGEPLCSYAEQAHRAEAAREQAQAERQQAQAERARAAKADAQAQAERARAELANARAVEAEKQAQAERAKIAELERMLAEARAKHRRS